MGGKGTRDRRRAEDTQLVRAPGTIDTGELLRDAETAEGWRETVPVPQGVRQRHEGDAPGLRTRIAGHENAKDRVFFCLPDSSVSPSPGFAGVF